MGFSPFPVLILIGVVASFQQFFLSQSHRYAETSALAPLHYIAIPIGILVGAVFFGEVITAKFIFGSLIILGANYYIFLRERAVKKSILQNEFIYILSRSSLRTGLSCLVAIYSQGNLWARF